LELKKPGITPDPNDWPVAPLGKDHGRLSGAAAIARLQYRWRLRGLTWGAAAGASIAWIAQIYFASTDQPLHIIFPDPTALFIGVLAGALFGYTIAGFLLGIINL
jgi:hypothetical protein